MSTAVYGYRGTLEQRSVIGKLETSSTGNLILRVGRQDHPNGPWFQTEHVVLSPEDVDRFLTEIRNLGFISTAQDLVEASVLPAADTLSEVPAEFTANPEEAFSGRGRS